MAGMKRRTIKRIIEAKLDAWLKTVPPEIRAKVENHLIVTGGCIASMLLGETVNDFDIYCDDIDTAALLATYYVTTFNASRTSVSKRIKVPYVKYLEDTVGNTRVAVYVKSAGAIGEDSQEDSYQYFETQPADNTGADEYVASLQEATKDEKHFRPIFLSENAITLSDKIQIVIRFTGDPNQIHLNYDYVHATNYYYSKTKQLVFRSEALESLLSKSLNYQGSLYPVCSLFRMRKFMDRGWTISAGEIIKMAMQISDLDLRDMEVLREQLIGVDAAYMHELLHMLTKFTEDNPGKPIEASYVMQLIDHLADRETGLM